MRIVGGRFKGRRLSAPDGIAVRPTADRTREALFDILAQGRVMQAGRGLVGARVLDAFAGTGALGLEALSRGAAQIVFMESLAAALAALRKNVLALDALGQVALYRADVLHPPRCRHENEACDIVLMDPPYNQGLAVPALEALSGAGWLADGALIAIELMKIEPFDPPEGFAMIDERKYGKAKLMFLRYAGS